MVGKVNRTSNVIPLGPRKKRPGKEDYKPKYDPDKPPDGAA